MLFLIFLVECRGEEVTVTEGGQITLTCRYETDCSSTYLFWYQQRANDKPKYMLSRFKTGTGERFYANLSITTKSVPLMIQGLQLSDSAVYYCALRPTVATGCTYTVQKLCVHVSVGFCMLAVPIIGGSDVDCANNRGFCAILLFTYFPVS
uniref:Ig-like domain-containing protein n=1 Tax=Esox lucius TaxID=8010 RepID=A0AAY5KC85_ESOLU